jgi:hypothetical protein
MDQPGRSGRAAALAQSRGHLARLREGQQVVLPPPRLAYFPCPAARTTVPKRRRGLHSTVSDRSAWGADRTWPGSSAAVTPRSGLRLRLNCRRICLSGGPDSVSDGAANTTRCPCPPYEKPPPPKTRPPTSASWLGPWMESLPCLAGSPPPAPPPPTSSTPLWRNSPSAPRERHHPSLGHRPRGNHENEFEG